MSRIYYACMVSVFSLLACELGCAAPDDPVLSSTQGETFEAFKARTYVEAANNNRYLVEGDLPIDGDDALYKHWQDRTPGALTLAQNNGVDVRWSAADVLNITYCVSNNFDSPNSYGANKADAVRAMVAAADEWKRRANVQFTYLSQYDSNCTTSNNSVTFAVVWNNSATGPTASAFFPDAPKSQRVLTTYHGFFSLPGDNEHKMRVFGHELGHILGFRHEFVRPETPASCHGETDTNWRPLTAYDSKSIMQYSCTTPMTPAWTELDTQGVQSMYGAPRQFSKDILWRDTDGTVAVWRMEHGYFTAQDYPPSPGTTFQIAGTGDFDGDRKADVLWRRTTDGIVRIWKMDGTTIAQSFDYTSPGTAWAISGVGDFDHDGMSDILWRNTNGSVMIWFMDSKITYKVISLRANLVLSVVPGNDWQIAGVGDFNADAKSDILWRDTDGTVAIWMMDGSTIVLQQYPGSVGNEWQINGVGQFNGDLNSDILWRANNGQIAIWFMNGGTNTAQAYPGAPGLDWQIAGVGNFSDTGSGSDILWRDTDGTVAIWFMNGGTNTAQTYPGAPGLDWQIKGVAAFKQFAP
jgi:hypothetical protein